MEETDQTQPDWDRLARETPFGRDEWIAAAQYLGDLPNWRFLFRTVESTVLALGCSPLSAAPMVRHSYLTSPCGGHIGSITGVAR